MSDNLVVLNTEEDCQAMLLISQKLIKYVNDLVIKTEQISRKRLEHCSANPVNSFCAAIVQLENDLNIRSKMSVKSFWQIIRMSDQQSLTDQQIIQKKINAMDPEIKAKLIHKIQNLSKQHLNELDDEIKKYYTPKSLITHDDDLRALHIYEMAKIRYMTTKKMRRNHAPI